LKKKHNTYSTELRDTRETVFVVDFLLLCEGKRLEDAQLKANVLYLSPTGEKKTLFTIPVAVGENGTYSVSWSTAHEASPSGTYRVIIYRETDRLRSSERKAKKETEGELPADIILFHIDFDHELARSNSLFLRNEFIAVLILGSVFAILYYKKTGFEKK